MKTLIGIDGCSIASGAGGSRCARLEIRPVHRGEQKANLLSSSPMPARSCIVSFTGPSGVRRSVEVTAESLYEAAAVGLSLLRRDDWGEATAPGTQLEVHIAQPALTYGLSVAQLRRWCDGIAGLLDNQIRQTNIRERPCRSRKKFTSDCMPPTAGRNLFGLLWPPSA
jgi:hypothetical protein